MPLQEPKDRIKNFDEVALGYSEEEAIEEAKRCILCGKCKPGCPVEIDIPGFIDCVKDGNFQKALDVIKEKNALPAICGRVCPQEDQCEKLCVIGVKDEPVAIGRLERFVADHGKTGKDVKGAKATGFKVAVIGAGPAGLTCAAQTARLGHKVTLFESLHEPGGVLMYGIPEFRLPKEIVKQEIEYIKGIGVEVKTDYLVGSTISLDEILEEFDAAFIGTGAGLPNFLEIPGEHLNGVFSANEFLIRSNLMKAYEFPKYDTPVKIGKNVAVIGAGNVAMDSARVAMRLGGEEVYIVYRRSEAEMPARAEEIEHAREEGIQLKLLTLPIEIVGEDGKVTALRCTKMKLGEPDESGRRGPVTIEGAEFEIPADVVIVAIGQSPNPLLPQKTPGLKTDDIGRIVVDDNRKTSIEGVYAGGDITTGAATVIEAMGAGKTAAMQIHEYLTK